MQFVWQVEVANKHWNCRIFFNSPDKYSQPKLEENYFSLNCLEHHYPLSIIHDSLPTNWICICERWICWNLENFSSYPDFGLFHLILDSKLLQESVPSMDIF